MSTLFKPCVSRTACTEDGEACRGCGRSHAEINAVRAQVQQLSAFMQQMDYQNPEAFLRWLHRKVLKRLKA